MSKIKVAILGSSGFVGQNLVRIFKSEPTIDLFVTSRISKADNIQFDLLESTSWKLLVDLQPDLIIDASGYGVVKNQIDLETLYQINYLEKRNLVDYLFKYIPGLFWIQIGTAFEYSMEQEQLTEQSLCFPKTHYGISKLLFTNYLLQHMKQQCAVIRPFGMFGKGEDLSKFFPMLIKAQKENKVIDLSDGQQERDYIFVEDLAQFILNLVVSGTIQEIDSNIINVGSGKPRSLRELSQLLSRQIPDYDPNIWNWGALPQRQGESQTFYNASSKARELGFYCTDLNEALQKTANYYYNL
ncbi:NAD(P)-dependent oxidoreductase [Dyadobacter sp. CY347]|uniref:NAD-dependent epimerase/dehydratase family protein n=1 Tax=Dyadobacter sp. CY347 TaxID=2909336 RepID=UPI001F4512AE|nr:NAD(P)-dependent oxidoreductase [Dyadobacter sp. CY347]MCF2491090.1 NAD(P)-dependent oxidoreductase [Dyadobacter sp. CY347]